MIVVTIRAQSEKRGYKTAYALGKALGVSPTLAARLWKGELKKIGVDSTLNSLCKLLRCQPNQLMRYEAEGED